MTNLEIIEAADRLTTIDLSTIEGAKVTFAIISNLDILTKEAALIRKTIKYTPEAEEYNKVKTKIFEDNGGVYSDNGNYKFSSTEVAKKVKVELEELDAKSEKALEDIKKTYEAFDAVCALENEQITNRLLKIELSDLKDNINANQMLAIKFMIK